MSGWKWHGESNKSNRQWNYMRRTIHGEEVKDDSGLVMLWTFQPSPASTPFAERIPYRKSRLTNTTMHLQQSTEIHTPSLCHLISACSYCTANTCRSPLPVTSITHQHTATYIMCAKCLHVDIFSIYNCNVKVNVDDPVHPNQINNINKFAHFMLLKIDKEKLQPITFRQTMIIP